MKQIQSYPCSELTLTHLHPNALSNKVVGASSSALGNASELQPTSSPLLVSTE